MSRVQLAIDVPELNEAIHFYRRLLRVEPHKVRPGYANFEVADPPLKLVLVENGRGGALNHLGIEVGEAAEVASETRRLAAAGLANEVESQVVCCHAEQDKVWVRDPGGIRWEVYAITDDNPDMLAARVPAAVPTDAAAASSEPREAPAAVSGEATQAVCCASG